MGAGSVTASPGQHGSDTAPALRHWQPPLEVSSGVSLHADLWNDQPGGSYHVTSPMVLSLPCCDGTQASHAVRLWREGRGGQASAALASPARAPDACVKTPPMDVPVPPVAHLSHVASHICHFRHVASDKPSQPCGSHS